MSRSVRVVHLPAIDRRVSLASYLTAVKKAKAYPEKTFSHGLTCWWPCTGEEIMRQFVTGIHDRINQGVPYSRRGMDISPFKIQNAINQPKPHGGII